MARSSGGRAAAPPAAAAPPPEPPPPNPAAPVPRGGALELTTPPAPPRGGGFSTDGSPAVAVGAGRGASGGGGGIASALARCCAPTLPGPKPRPRPPLPPSGAGAGAGMSVGARPPPSLSPPPPPPPRPPLPPLPTPRPLPPLPPLLPSAGAGARAGTSVDAGPPPPSPAPPPPPPSSPSPPPPSPPPSFSRRRLCPPPSAAALPAAAAPPAAAPPASAVHRDSSAKSSRPCSSIDRDAVLLTRPGPKYATLQFSPTVGVWCLPTRASAMRNACSAAPADASMGATMATTSLKRGAADACCAGTLVPRKQGSLAKVASRFHSSYRGCQAELRLASFHPEEARVSAKSCSTVTCAPPAGGDSRATSSSFNRVTASTESSEVTRALHPWARDPPRAPRPPSRVSQTTRRLANGPAGRDTLMRRWLERDTQPTEAEARLPSSSC